MPRPKKCRVVVNLPISTTFKPDVSMNSGYNDFVVLKFEELEALRLCDFEAKKHSDAAIEMNVSRATIGRILEKARYQVADALLNGKSLSIQGGTYCQYRVGDKICRYQSENEIRKSRCNNCPDAHK